MNPIKFISKYETQIYAILRLTAGFLFLWHGSQKLFAFPPVAHEMPAYIVFVAGPVEFFGGLLAIIYCFLFLFIASRGSGVFSIGPLP